MRVGRETKILAVLLGAVLAVVLLSRLSGGKPHPERTGSAPQVTGPVVTNDPEAEADAEAAQEAADKAAEAEAAAAQAKADADAAAAQAQADKEAEAQARAAEAAAQKAARSGAAGR